MMPWFVWNNKNSLHDFGLWVNKLPPHVRAEERHEEIEIPGRAGSLLMLEGEDVYSSYTMELVVVGRNSLPYGKIIDWLRGSSNLILCTDESLVIEASIVGEVSFNRLGNNLQQATIPFLCKPLRKHRYPVDDVITLANDGVITNPGDVASKPKVSITASGTVTVTIAGNAMSFSGVDGTIVVDCGANIVTSGGNIWTGIYSGDFWSIPKGNSEVDIGTAATVTIEPNWRWF